MTPHQFLDLLWQYKPEELYVLIWTLPDKQSYWFQEVKAAAEFVLKARGLDVYVGVGLSGKNYGPHHRCISEEIAGISGLHADLDLLSEAHKKALPATIPEALSILPAAMEPTVVVGTGNGCHAWWLTREPYIFDNEEDRRAVANISVRWHSMLRHNAARKGWAYERLSDLARVLRIPGTLNLKNPLAPREIKVHSFSGKFIIEAIPRQGYQHRSRTAKLFRSLKGRFWVDQHDYQIVKVEAEVIDTISVGLFLVRVAKGSRATLKLTRVSDEVWLPDRLQVFASARLGLLKAFRFEQRVHYSRYSCVPNARTMEPAQGRAARGARFDRFAKVTSP